MKFFIDTANLEQIRKAHELGVLDGVTTNPSLMAKENIRGTENCNRHYVEICNIVEGDEDLIGPVPRGPLVDGRSGVFLGFRRFRRIKAEIDGVKRVVLRGDLPVKPVDELHA